ncbi:hypothetical protein [Lysobacter sp. Root494]|uniref:esterase/lipase family protein n=1 Tax=Lysobacter sp. Root494 TaxID=1736549 RepID=UPI0006F22966|nr:hypothetical protein [Lysobacter sp. Root494]KQY50464.1 hypothetical protein ASD14_12185 [Lysobacter sp. Root494]
MTRHGSAPDATPSPASDLRGVNRLAVDGVTGMADLVEAVHAAVMHPPALLGRHAPGTTRGIPHLVYRSVRGIARMAGGGVDLSLSALAPVLRERGLSPRREAVVAALNGVLGDHLSASGNPLAIRMQFRRDGVPLVPAGRELHARIPQASGRLLVQVHGLCMNDLQWRQDGHDHGEALARDFGCTVVHLHYNSGRHVSDNGGEFAALLTRLVKAWPVPAEEITLLCHSMGGLVARSALDAGFRRRMAWTRLPLRVVFLGTPHHGAPLERAGSWADLLIGITPYSAPFVRLGRMRSAGIQDLRHGNVRETDRHDVQVDARADTRRPLPLPASVRAHAIATTTRQAGDDDAAAMHGDGLVPLASALGDHPDPAFDLRIPPSRRWIGYGINHLQMLRSEAVYRRMADWLREPM